MSTQHTPGPWKTNGDQNGDPVVFSNDLSHFIAFTDTCGISSDEAKANARLIAAAPDLLKAIEAVKAWDLSNLDLDIPLEIRKQIQAAIAKATGAE